MSAYGVNDIFKIEEINAGIKLISDNIASLHAQIQKLGVKDIVKLMQELEKAQKDLAKSQNELNKIQKAEDKEKRAVQQRAYNEVFKQTIENDKKAVAEKKKLEAATQKQIDSEKRLIELQNKEKLSNKELMEITNLLKAKRNSMVVQTKEEIREYNRLTVAIEKNNRELLKQDKNISMFQRNVGNYISGFKGFMATLGLAGGIALAFQTLKGISTEMFSITSKFEKYNAVLKNAVGSQAEATKSMKMLKEIAAQTPFTVDELTNAFIKFQTRGVKLTKDQIIGIGDFAATLGKPFEQVAEAIFDTTNASRRWTEIGVKMRKVGSDVELTFKGQTKVVAGNEKAIAQGVAEMGRYVGVAGSMAAISKTLEGRVSNLKDQWDFFLVSLGSGDFSTAAKSVIEFLTNMLKSFSKGNEFTEALKLWYNSITQIATQLLKLFEALNLTVSGTNSAEKSINALGIALQVIMTPFRWWLYFLTQIINLITWIVKPLESFTSGVTYLKLALRGLMVVLLPIPSAVFAILKAFGLFDKQIETSTKLVSEFEETSKSFAVAAVQSMLTGLKAQQEITEQSLNLDIAQVESQINKLELLKTNQERYGSDTVKTLQSLNAKELRLNELKFEQIRLSTDKNANEKAVAEIKYNDEILKINQKYSIEIAKLKIDNQNKILENQKNIFEQEAEIELLRLKNTDATEQQITELTKKQARERAKFELDSAIANLDFRKNVTKDISDFEISTQEMQIEKLRNTYFDAKKDEVDTLKKSNETKFVLQQDYIKSLSEMSDNQFKTELQNQINSNDTTVSERKKLKKQLEEIEKAQLAATKELEINQAKELLQYRINNSKLTPEELQNYQTTIIALEFELAKLKEKQGDPTQKNWLMEVLGLDEKNYQALQQQASKFLNNLANYVNSALEESKRQADEEISNSQRVQKEKETALEKENSLLEEKKRAGVAYSLSEKQRLEKEIQEEKKREAEIQKERDKIAKRQKQMALATAAVNGAVAITEIWAAYGEVFPVAIALSALVAASTALQIATINKQKFEKGGSYILQGNSHAAGGIDMGGGREAEGGEAHSIFSKKATAKHFPLIKHLTNLINSDKIDKLQPILNIAVDSGNSDKYLEEIAKNTATKTYINKDGRRVVISDNVTSIYS